MDNFTLPDIQMNASEGQLTQDVTSLQSYSSIYRQQAQNAPFFGGGSNLPSPGIVDQFFGKIGSVFGEAGHMFESAAAWVGRQGINMAKGTIMAAPDLIKFGMDTFHTFEYSQQQGGLMNQLHEINQKYNSGQISLSEYNAQMKDWQQQNSQLGKNLQDLTTKIGSDGKQFIHDDTAFISAVLTVASSGLSGAAETIGKAGAADVATMLMGKTADEAMTPIEEAIARLAANKAEFGSLSQATQTALKASVTDTFMNAAKDATAQQLARTAAVNIFLKYPLTFNALNSTGTQLYNEMASGKYGAAAKTFGFNVALALSGGPIGQALNYGGAALKAVSTHVFGQTSFLDILDKNIGDGSIGSIYNAIKDDPKAIKAFQALEATNVAAENGNIAQGAYRVLNGLKANGWDLSTSTPEEFVKNVMGWHEAQSTLTNALIKSGMSEAEAAKYVVGRWTIHDANNAAAAIIKGDAQLGQTVEGRLKAFEDYKAQFPNSAVANNENLTRQITNIIKTTHGDDELGAAIRNIKAQYVAKLDNLSPEVWKKLGNLGYVPIAPPKLEAPFIQGTQKLLTSASENSEFFQKAVQPLPVMREFGAFMTQLGLSPERSQQSTYDIFTANLTKNLQGSSALKDVNTRLEARFAEKQATKQATVKAAEVNTGGFTKDEMAFMKKQGITPESNPEMFTSKAAISGGKEAKVALESPSPSTVNTFVPKDSDYLVKRLSNYVNKINNGEVGRLRPPITDMRQMTTKEIGAALRIGSSSAKEVANAINQSMLDMSLAERGLGPKFTDLIQSVNTGSKLSMNSYLRAQGATRFAWNPFFKMKLAAKTEILSSLEGKGYFGSQFDRALGLIFHGKSYDLKGTARLMDSKGLFGGIGYTGEAANEAVAATKNVTGQVLKSQKMSISALINSQAERAGLSVEAFIDNYPQEVRNTVDSILHYNPRGNFINSPLAKTLNFAFFPFRFNVKVAGFMARALANQDAVTQIAVIHGMMQAHDFLTSAQGQVWYSQNSDAIKLLSYFSPLETLSTIAELGHIGHDSIGSYGELGGLPLGFIPQLLQAEGLWHPAQPYLNPKTGQAAPQYIPESAKAKLATAVSSFLGSLFTYPGSEAGLPSKTKLLSNLAQGVTGAKSTDWQKVTPTNLTPEQQQFQRAVQTLPQNMQNQNSVTPQPQTQSTIAPPTANSNVPPVFTPSELRSRNKVKKTQEPLSLLPGQTTIGQLP